MARHERHIPATWPIGFADFARGELDQVRHATVQVVAQSADEAYSRAREAVAVLRLFQRARYRRVNLDIQTFGLPGDFDTRLVPYWTIARHRPALGGWAREGILGDWTFPREDRLAFGQDAVFQFLDRALRTTETERTEFERRALTAILVRHLAIPSRPDALRIPFVAVTLEALLGDKRSRDKAHRIAQRVAFQR